MGGKGSGPQEAMLSQVAAIVVKSCMSFFLVTCLKFLRQSVVRRGMTLQKQGPEARFWRGGLPSLPQPLSCYQTPSSLLGSRALQMPSREAPSSAGRSPECRLGCRQGMTQEGRKQMRFGNGQSGQTSQHHLVAVGDSGPRDILSQSFISLPLKQGLTVGQTPY